MSNNKSSFTITLIICSTIVIVFAIGGWVYINNKKIAQDDAQFKNSQDSAELDRKLKEEQIEQQKNQNRNDCYAEANPNNPFETALCAEM